MRVEEVIGLPPLGMETTERQIIGRDWGPGYLELALYPKDDKKHSWKPKKQFFRVCPQV